MPPCTNKSAGKKDKDPKAPKRCSGCKAQNCWILFGKDREVLSLARRMYPEITDDRVLKRTYFEHLKSVDGGINKWRNQSKCDQAALDSRQCPQCGRPPKHYRMLPTPVYPIFPLPEDASIFDTPSSQSRYIPSDEMQLNIQSPDAFLPPIALGLDGVGPLPFQEAGRSFLEKEIAPDTFVQGSSNASASRRARQYAPYRTPPRTSVLLRPVPLPGSVPRGPAPLPPINTPNDVGHFGSNTAVHNPLPLLVINPLGVFPHNQSHLLPINPFGGPMYDNNGFGLLTTETNSHLPIDSNPCNGPIPTQYNDQYNAPTSFPYNGQWPFPREQQQMMAFLPSPMTVDHNDFGIDPSPVDADSSFRAGPSTPVQEDWSSMFPDLNIV